MKRIIYLLFLLSVVLGFSACEEDKEKTDVAGSWEYTSPYFEFEYLSDSISLVGNEGIKKSIAVKDLKNAFVKMADDKMGAYFKGIFLGTDQKLNIRMLMANQKEQILHATWLQSANYIEVSLDSTELKALTQGMVSQIPAISFSYRLEGDHLQMYFDKGYIDMLYAMMGDMIIEKMLIPMMGINPQYATEAKQKLKIQMDNIIKQIISLKIGFNLSRSK